MKPTLLAIALGWLCCAGCEPMPAGNESSGADPIVHLSSADFESRVLQSEQLVLVDFWAEWCGPCRAMEPAVAAIARKFEGQLVVGKVDVDAEPELAQQFQIEGIPALLLFRQGEVVEYLVGQRSERQLETALQPYLQAGPAER